MGWGLPFALRLSLPYQAEVCSLVVGVEAPDLSLRCDSDLQYEVKRIR